MEGNKSVTRGIHISKASQFLSSSLSMNEMIQTVPGVHLIT